MFECRKFRVELIQCPSSHFHVFIMPIEYLGKDEFKQWLRLCKRNFMCLVSVKPWRFEIVFSSYVDAVGFARNMTRQLEEIVFFDHAKSHVEVVTPKEAST